MPVNPPPKTQLDLLASLESGQVVTQGTISKRLGVSIGMINALLRRAVHKGYVKVKAAPYKRYAYYLTPTGFAEKSRLVAEYLEISLRFFRQARQEYSELLERAERAGLKRLALIGGGELAEIACLAAHEAEIQFVAVVNREANRDRMLGLPVVRDLAELEDIDGVLIADSQSPQATYDGLLELFDERRILAPALLRISRAKSSGPTAMAGEPALREANAP
ncbi:MAG: hypothetical protein ACFCUQ_07035 [Kiloniellales bacterium]